MTFMSKWILENDHCYLGWRPTVDTALIPPLSHPVFKDKTECITIYMELDPGIHIVEH
jgi:hypothetical protein